MIDLVLLTAEFVYGACGMYSSRPRLRVRLDPRAKGRLYRASVDD